jgi:hypothetical protein
MAKKTALVADLLNNAQQCTADVGKMSERPSPAPSDFRSSQDFGNPTEPNNMMPDEKERIGRNYPLLN